MKTSIEFIAALTVLLECNKVKESGEVAKRVWNEYRTELSNRMNDGVSLGAGKIPNAKKDSGSQTVTVDGLRSVGNRMFCLLKEVAKIEKSFGVTVPPVKLEGTLLETLSEWGEFAAKKTAERYGRAQEAREEKAAAVAA